MYQIGDKMWAVLHFSDTPKEVTIISVIPPLPSYGVIYKSREFLIPNQDIYPTQIDAEIYWALVIKQDYEYTLKNPSLFATDDYEIANLKADIIIQKYADQAPHLLLKYF